MVVTARGAYKHHVGIKAPFKVAQLGAKHVARVVRHLLHEQPAKTVDRIKAG